VHSVQQRCTHDIVLDINFWYLSIYLSISTVTQCTILHCRTLPIPDQNAMHWLDASARVMFKLVVITFSCVHGQSPQYQSHYLSVSEVTSWHRLWSVSRRLLVVPRYIAWVCLADVVLLLLVHPSHYQTLWKHRHIFKVLLLTTHLNVQHIRGSMMMKCYINQHSNYFTDLLTLLCGSVTDGLNSTHYASSTATLKAVVW